TAASCLSRTRGQRPDRTAALAYGARSALTVPCPRMGPQPPAASTTPGNRPPGDPQSGRFGESPLTGRILPAVARWPYRNRKFHRTHSHEWGRYVDPVQRRGGPPLGWAERRRREAEAELGRRVPGLHRSARPALR